jgi:plasmid stability protein
LTVSLSIKNVPEEVAAQLRERAKRHHRSMQGELLAILEEAAEPGKLTLAQAEQRLRALNFQTGDESTTWIRELRDAR